MSESLFPTLGVSTVLPSSLDGFLWEINTDPGGDCGSDACFMGGGFSCPTELLGVLEGDLNAVDSLADMPAARIQT